MFVIAIAGAGAALGFLGGVVMTKNEFVAEGVSRAKAALAHVSELAARSDNHEVRALGQQMVLATAQAFEAVLRYLTETEPVQVEGVGEVHSMVPGDALSGGAVVGTDAVERPTQEPPPVPVGPQPAGT